MRRVLLLMASKITQLMSCITARRRKEKWESSWRKLNVRQDKRKVDAAELRDKRSCALQQRHYGEFNVMREVIESQLMQVSKIEQG